MASPFGESGWTEAAKANGLFLNRGVGGGAVAPGGGADPYNLPTYMASEGETAETFNRLVDDARSDGEWLTLLFHSITPTNQEWYAPIDIGEITANVEHAKSYDDVWIDTVANVGAYWRASRSSSPRRPRNRRTRQSGSGSSPRRSLRASTCG